MFFCGCCFGSEDVAKRLKVQSRPGFCTKHNSHNRSCSPKAHHQKWSRSPHGTTNGAQPQTRPKNETKSAATNSKNAATNFKRCSGNVCQNFGHKNYILFTIGFLFEVLSLYGRNFGRLCLVSFWRNLRQRSLYFCGRSSQKFGRQSPCNICGCARPRLCSTRARAVWVPVKTILPGLHLQRVTQSHDNIP